MKRLTALVLFLGVLLGGFSLPAGLSEEEDGSYSILYTYISSISAALSISGSTAACYGQAVSSNSSVTITITMTLKRQSGSDWVSVRSWVGSGSGLSGASLNKSYTLSVSGNYRVTVYAVVKDSSGTILETASVNSVVKSY